jgi:hypothetical protein
LSVASKYLDLAALILMVFAIALVMSPAPYHQLVENGEDNSNVYRFTMNVMMFVLLAFALALGVDLFLASERLFKTGLSIGFAVGVTILALVSWYIFPFAARARVSRKSTEENMNHSNEKTKLKDKIDHVLTETRMVLPGAQTLLGFQFLTFLQESFEKLPQSSKYIHLASLFMTALAIVLLMTPASYHRIAEEGAETDRFHHLASRFLLLAMLPLGLGICGDFFIVMRKISESIPLSLLVSLLLAAFIYGLWFGLTVFERWRRQTRNPAVLQQSS